jgi:cAMP-binding proteins - catabolite gene activator and regulatory subunit of cAMP-dependent protein kinases
MKINYSDIKDGILFAGIPENDLEKLFNCIAPKEKTVEKGSFVFRAGDNIGRVYYLLSGTVHIIDEDFWGNSSIIETMYGNTLFGEAYIFSTMKKHLVSVVAAEEIRILEMSPMCLFETCTNGCTYHTQLVKNTVEILSEKVVRLTEKLGHVMRRTIREKLLSYLTKCSKIEKSNVFEIPYSRQQLADYLCVDRSALSHELSRLQEEGLLCYNKNRFELLDIEI